MSTFREGSLSSTIRPSDLPCRTEEKPRHSSACEKELVQNEASSPLNDLKIAAEEPPVSGSAQARPPPNGGLKAWLVVLGGFCAIFCTFGQLNSFGIFQAFYQDHLLADKSPSTIAWIGSLQVLVLFLGGLASGPLMDRNGIRAVLIPSSLALVFGIMMTSISTKYYQFVLAQGLLEGLSFGFIFTPVISVVGQYFTTKRAFAMGIVASGGSVGGVVFPIVLDRLINSSSLGFGWTLRVVGFIMLALLALSCILMVEHAPRRANHVFLPEAFRSLPFVLINLSFVFLILGLWTPVFYIVDYAKVHGINTQLAFYEAAILNGVSFFGRTLPGFAADKIGRYNAMIFMTLWGAIMLFCWTAATTPAGITIWIAIYGFPAGAVVSLYSPCVAQVCPSPSNIGTYIGMGSAMYSVAGLAVGPINGALIARYGFLQSSIFSGVMMLAGVACQVVAKLYLNRNFWAVV